MVAHVPAGDLAAFKEIEQRKTLTVAQSRRVAETASHLGYAIEPDPRLTAKGWKWNSKVAVFHDQEPNDHLQPGSMYGAASVLLHLSMSIAAADGEASKEEIEIISEFMEGQFMLSSSSKKRLEVLGNILLQDKISLAGIGKRIQEHLDHGQRSKVGQFLVAVAAADGIFYKSEITALKRAYKAIGLNPQEAVDLVNQMCLEAGARIDEPVVVRRAKPGAPGEPIPPPPEEDEAATPPAVQLDRNAIARILAETKEVSQLLGKVLAEGGEDGGLEVAGAARPGADKQPAGAPPAPLTTAPAAPGATIAGVSVAELDVKYHAFVQKVLGKEVWSEPELREAAGSCGLMVGGAVEAINEWSDDHLGDFLIAGDGPYTVNSDLFATRG